MSFSALSTSIKTHGLPLWYLQYSQKYTTFGGTAQHFGINHLRNFNVCRCPLTGQVSILTACITIIIMCMY